jgi:hypothetical protein
MYKILFSVILLLGISGLSFSQNQPHLLDLRTCTNKSCTSNNYNIVGFYLSDINGTPITNSLLICTPGVEQTVYITLRYQANANSGGVDNTRFFADFKVGNETQFLNYYFGQLIPGASGTGTLTMSNFPVNWTCGAEISFNRPVLAWTTNDNSDLSQSYACNSYPGGQCQNQSALLVDAPLAVQFDYSYTCPSTDVTPVSFTNSTNGGREPYQFSWTFTNATVESSDSENPIVDFIGPGTATLQVTDASGTINTYYSIIDLPTFFKHIPVIGHQTDENSPNGFIELETDHSGSFTYSWTGPNGFASDEKNIYELSEGTYQVTITDSFGCTEDIDLEINYFITLPLLRDDLNATLKEDYQSVNLTWSSNFRIGRGYFEVERALNNINSFNKVGKLPITDSVTEISNYLFTDSNLPKFSSRIYYRIKLAPETDKPIYGSTIMIEIPRVNSQKKWSAFPNPFEWNNLQLIYTGDPRLLKGLIHIKVYSPTSAFSTQFSTIDTHIDLGNYIQFAPKGILIIEVNNQEKMEFLKILKK